MSAVPQPTFNEKGVIVQHHEGAAPTVDQDRIELRSDLGDEMNWTCDHPGKRFRVTFVGRSPFASSTFNEVNYRSGPIVSGATGEYKYSVEIDGKINDPKVIIQP